MDHYHWIDSNPLKIDQISANIFLISRFYICCQSDLWYYSFWFKCKFILFPNPNFSQRRLTVQICFGNIRIFMANQMSMSVQVKSMLVTTTMNEWDESVDTAVCFVASTRNHFRLCIKIIDRSLWIWRSLSFHIIHSSLSWYYKPNICPMQNFSIYFQQFQKGIAQVSSDISLSFHCVKQSYWTLLSLQIFG